VHFLSFLLIPLDLHPKSRCMRNFMFLILVDLTIAKDTPNHLSKGPTSGSLPFQISLVFRDYS